MEFDIGHIILFLFYCEEFTADAIRKIREIYCGNKRGILWKIVTEIEKWNFYGISKESLYNLEHSFELLSTFRADNR